MGRPFLTAYQIAIEFARRHPDIVKELGWPVGGEGMGKRNTLAQYLARWLSQLVKDNPDGLVEGGFLSNQHLDDIRFDNSACIKPDQSARNRGVQALAPGRDRESGHPIRPGRLGHRKSDVNIDSQKHCELMC